MCGQAGVFRRTNAPIAGLGRLVDELLIANESRGPDATGFLALMDNGDTVLDRKTQPAMRFVRKRKRIPADARAVLGHTRWATVGSRRKVKNAHPQTSGRIAVTHNGTISNADEIFKAFDLPRKAEVDSEVIPALIDYAGWENLDAALSFMDGGAACAIVNVERPKELVLTRLYGFPLCYATTKDLVIWASTEQAIRRAWWMAYGKSFRGRVYHLAEGQIARFDGRQKKVTTIEGWKPRPVWRPKSAWGGEGRKKKKGKKKRAASVPPLDEKPRQLQLQPVVRPVRDPDEDEDLIEILIQNGWTRQEAEWEILGSWDDVGWDDDYDTSGMSPATRAFYALD